MDNIDVKVTGNKMILTVDISKRFGLSKSGKTQIIASSKGNATVAPGVIIGLNVFTKDKVEDSE